MRPKFKVGDEVRVKDFDTLVREFGTGIQVPSRFVEDMRRSCGGEYVVERVVTRQMDGKHSYILKGGRWWKYDECVLEKSDEFTLDMSFDDMFGG